MLDPLVSFLRSTACKPLLDGLRKRAERSGSFTGKLRLRGLSDAERNAVAAVTGQPTRRDYVSLDLAAFDQVVRNTARFDSLLQLVEIALGGVIENKREARKQHTQAWRDVWEWAASLAQDIPARQRWLDELRQSGWLKARTRGNSPLAQQMLATSFRLLDVLPVTAIPLPVLAARELNDAHALDLDRDLGRLVCRGIAATHGLPTPRKRSEFRRTWQSVGVVPDELSVTVLVLNLPAVGESLTDHVLRAHTRCGEPCRLTFRQLRLHLPRLEPGNNATLFVCENPSVIASAAERLGANCRPLVCVEGQPNLAAARLLNLAVDAGWRIAYHGDFDCGGLRIGNWLYEQIGFTPWHFDAVHYRAFSRDRRSLTATPPPALWDLELARAMIDGGYVVEEEHFIEQLLADLAAVRSEKR